ncbi:MAG: type II secretion system GspH family protein [Candidatus Fibromonas sp.]|jgi:type II secretory pathway pseudopilin PulG|nr:type II secretion system GspH family protein [Candidatus Fibromonas sp.]
MRNKSAFTLIELLVYMAIMGFIIVVAGRVFSDATVMRVRSQNMIKTAEQVGNAANLITEDISQMGVKTWAYSSASSFVIDTKPEVYMTLPTALNPDLSSFQLYRGAVNVANEACGKIIREDTKFDSLLFRRAEFNENGSFLGVREISWAVNNQCELRRWCKTINGTANGECPAEALGVIIAKNIRKFSLYASAPGAQPSSGSNSPALSPDTIFPITANTDFKLESRDADAANGLQTVSSRKDNTNAVAVVFNLDKVKNDVSPQGGPPANKTRAELYFVPSSGNIPNCHQVPIKKGETWVVEFNMPFSSEPIPDKQDSMSTQFLPGQDHIAVGLRYSDHASVGDAFSKDVIFYPSQDEFTAGQSARHAEIFAKADPAPNKKVCVALTLSFYSPIASEGTYHFSNFMVYRKPTGTYHFVKAENGYESNFANVYATESDGPNKLKHKRKVKAFELLLEIDQNGEVAGTYSQGIKPDGTANAGVAIPVPNNGGA